MELFANRYVLLFKDKMSWYSMTFYILYRFELYNDRKGN